MAAIAVGFVAIVWGADRFVAGASSTAASLRVPSVVVGLILVAIGTSAPEIFVSGTAAVSGFRGLGVGNAIGSNIANTGLVLGLAAIINPLRVHPHIVRKDLPFLVAVCLGAGLILVDGRIDRWESLCLVVGLIGFVVHATRAHHKTLEPESEPRPLWASLLMTLAGLVLLLLSSRFVVWGATSMAEDFGLSETVIGLTLVAFGTSLPELATTVVAAWKNEHDIAVGNIVGSNIFNLCAVLPLPGLIVPGALDAQTFSRDYLAMLVTLALLVLAVYSSRKRTIRRPAGIPLLIAFVGYMYWVFLK